MRTDQHMGLTYRAKRFLQLNKTVAAYTEETVRVYPDGTRRLQSAHSVFRPVTKQEPSGEVYSGMFGNEYQLSKYELSDGRVFFEYVQASPWSSGPCFFLALKDSNGAIVSESLWSADEMELNT